jgi:hypothetical protein
MVHERRTCPIHKQQNIKQQRFTSTTLLESIKADAISILRPSNSTELLDDHSELEPPDPIPNSEVKRLSADGSVGFPHVRVGHRQALNPNPLQTAAEGFFCPSFPSISKTYNQTFRYKPMSHTNFRTCPLFSGAKIITIAITGR